MSTGEGDDEFTMESGVTISHVRHELGDGQAKLLDSGALQYHLGKAESFVAGEATASATDAQVKDAVAIDAAWRFASSQEDTFAETISELDVRETYDASSYIDSLKERRDEALEAVRDEWFAVTR